MLEQARKRGLHESVELGGDIWRARRKRRSDRRRRFVFLSPPLTNSGAPLILLQVVHEFVSRFGSESVRLLAPRGVAEPREALAASGVKLERAAEVLNAPLVRL